MQKSTTFTTIFRVNKCYFHYDFACKKVPLSLRYAKNKIALLLEIEWGLARVWLCAIPISFTLESRYTEKMTHSAKKYPQLTNRVI
jgi:hypothetical protein